MVIYSDTRRRLEAEKRIEADDIHKAYMTVSEVQYLVLRLVQPSEYQEMDY